MDITRLFTGVEPHRGAVFLFSKSHGAVRCGLHFFIIIRCGAVQFCSLTLRCGAVRCGVAISTVSDPSESGRVDMLTGPVAAARAAVATGAWVKSKQRHVSDTWYVEVWELNLYFSPTAGG